MQLNDAAVISRFAIDTMLWLVSVPDQPIRDQSAFNLPFLVVCCLICHLYAPGKNQHVLTHIYDQQCQLDRALLQTEVSTSENVAVSRGLCAI